MQLELVTRTVVRAPRPVRDVQLPTADKDPYGISALLSPVQPQYHMRFVGLVKQPCLFSVWHYSANV